MTLFTLENNPDKYTKKPIIVYVVITVFCALFYFIYNRFAHGVHSPYMTFLFLRPLLLGVIPALILLFTKSTPPNRVTRNIWNSGVSAVTVSSALRGIFEIAGTSSRYQPWITYSGILFLVVALGMYIFTTHIAPNRPSRR